jgi:DNA invertase Pin-like site-specific DNA recombinase
MELLKHAVGYCRVSTGDQVIANQTDKLRERGVSVLFCDEGVSGSIPAMERPDFKEMIKYLDSHKEIKIVAVFEISRLGRSFQDSINTFLNLENRGLIVYSLTEVWTHATEPSMRKLLISIVSWLNDQELTRLKVRIRAGIDHAKKFGTKKGGPIGKPPKNINRESVEALRKTNMSWHKIADSIGCEVSTLFKYRQAWKRKDLGREPK